MSFQVPDPARPPRQPTGPARTNRPFPPALEEVFTRRSRHGQVFERSQFKLIRGGRAEVARRPALECTVVHHVPGRVRLRLPLLKSAAGFAEHLRAALARQPGIISVRVTAACASVVVTFDPRQVTVAHIREWLIRTAAMPGRGRLPAVAPRDGRARPESAVVAGAVAIGATRIGPSAGRNLIEELVQCLEVSDVLEVVWSGLRGDLRLALLSVGLALVGRYARAVLARRVQPAYQQRAKAAPVVLPAREATALAA